MTSGSRARTRSPRSLPRFLVACVAAITTVVAGTAGPLPSAEAANASDFVPGRLVSDAVFYDYQSMTEAEIQSFLDARGSACVAGEMPCLKDFRETTKTRPLEVGLCWQYTGASNESAARIIRKVATACEINPRVLLVTLEKENSLVGRTRPTAKSYQTAMGFGCPDTAPCNTEYYGFSNQVYRAARQFLVYRANATRYGYQAGRTNTIGFHPDATCGSSQVYIENQATAALYIYTPYQPNAAALANLYGSGDRCSTYGNRNFWRIFSDWFGDPTAGRALVRTADDDRVYLLVGQERHHVADFSLYQTLRARLGAVGVVSPAALQKYADAGPMSRVVRDPGDGALYWLANGMRHRFPSCSTVTAWTGASCASSYVDLTTRQIGAFPQGALLGTTVSADGQSWAVSGARRHEILDERSRTAAGLPPVQATVAGAVVAPVPVGAPVVRDAVVATDRASGAAWLLTGGSKTAVPADLLTTTPLRDLVAGRLSTASLSLVPGSATLSPVLVGPGDAVHVLGTSAAWRVPSSTTTGRPRTVVPQSVLDALPRQTSVQDRTVFLQEVGQPRIWAVQDGGRRAVARWTDLVAATGTSPEIISVPGTTLRAFPELGPTLDVGSLVKNPTSPRVYVVDGFFALVPVESFSDTRSLGLGTQVATVPASTLGAYRATTAPLAPVVDCPTVRGLGISGAVLRRASTAIEPATLPRTTLTSGTCTTLAWSSAPPVSGPVFVKGSAPTVYVLDDTHRRAVGGWAELIALNGGQSRPAIVVLNDAALARIPLSPVG
ncbi:hypothetical protein [Cellulosimicrobium sp. NPDC057862]|uniref:hypothetical protein n=1 Tax=Cellulosimicrobium sp. NPDC057862 TaxID=3346266 RepID=UPI00367049B0